MMQQHAAKRLTLSARVGLRAPALAAGGAGVVLIAAVLAMSGARLPLFPGVLVLLPLLWALRPVPTTMIDRHVGVLITRSASGRIEREERFGRIEGVTTDQVTLSSGITVYRTLLKVSGGDVVAVQGFGAQAPARAQARRIEAWLQGAPAIEPAL